MYYSDYTAPIKRRNTDGITEEQIRNATSLAQKPTRSRMPPLKKSQDESSPRNQDNQHHDSSEEVGHPSESESESGDSLCILPVVGLLNASGASLGVPTINTGTAGMAPAKPVASPLEKRNEGSPEEFLPDLDPRVVKDFDIYSGKKEKKADELSHLDEQFSIVSVIKQAHLDPIPMKPLGGPPHPMPSESTFQSRKDPNAQEKPYSQLEQETRNSPAKIRQSAPVSVPSPIVPQRTAGAAKASGRRQENQSAGNVVAQLSGNDTPQKDEFANAIMQEPLMDWDQQNLTTASNEWMDSSSEKAAASQSSP